MTCTLVPASVTDGTVLKLTVTNMAPGDYCNIGATIVDTGTLPGTLGSSAPCSGSYCSDFYYSDNVDGAGPTIAGSGGTFSYTGQIGLYSSAATQGESATFTITISATAY